VYVCVPVCVRARAHVCVYLNVCASALAYVGLCMYICVCNLYAEVCDLFNCYN